MMEDIIISVSSKTRMVNCLKGFIGNDGENLQGNIVFKFEDKFIDGIGRLEYSIQGIEKYTLLEKVGESYTVPIKSVLTKEGQINMQLVITEEEVEEGIPVFKSNVFYLYCSRSINAEIETPSEYPTWIEIANQKLIEVEKAIEEVKEFEIEVGTLEEDVRELGQEVNNLDNEVGNLSSNINEIATNVGINTDNINELERNYSLLQNELLEQEESINHLDDIKANKNEIPDVNEFVKKTTNDLVNYYLKTETYTQEEVNQLIGAIKTLNIEIVDVLPEIGDTNKIYFVPSEKTEEKNIYDEYIYVSNKWELIGSTKIDLSNYYTKDEINTLLFDYITSNDLEETLENYALKSDIKTKTSELENDSDFTTNEYVNEELDKIDDRIDEIQLTKFPNAIIHGNPVINQGQVSGFTRTDYLSLPAVFNLHDIGFEFNFAFRTGNDVSTAQNILGSRFCMALLIENSKLKLKVSQNGSSWDLVDIEGNITVQPNTIYYVQIYFDKLTYKLKYSTDGIEYTEIASKVASVSPNPAQIYLGVGNNFFNPFGGIINLNKCNLKVNNSVIWNGLDDAGLQTRLATDMENIDEAGIEFINNLIDSRGGGGSGTEIGPDEPTKESINLWVDTDEEGLVFNPADYVKNDDINDFALKDKMLVMTQEQYDEIIEKDINTLYFISEE